MFLLNSRLGLFAVTISQWYPFSRSYGAFLPSSLTTLLPPACGFSPHLPVSVCGTGSFKTIAAFLDSLDSSASLLYLQSTSRFSSPGRFCLSRYLCACTGLSIPGSDYPPVSPQFCLIQVQEYLPVVHRLRLSTSP